MSKQKLLMLLAVVMAVIGLMAGSASAELIDGLVEFWEFSNDYSAEVTADHAGTLTTSGTGSGTFVPGKFGQCVKLDSSSGNQAYIVIGGDENDFDFTGESMSVSLWYTTESLYVNYQTLVAKGEGGAWRLARRQGDGNLVQFAGPGSIIQPGNLSQQDGSWHHAVITVDAVSGTTSLYVDGVLAGTSTGTIGSSNAAMQIGGNPGAAGRAWDGNFDDVAVWNRAISEDEVALIWNGGAGARIGGFLSTGPEIIYPQDEEVVPQGDVALQWVNLDPNSLSGATETYVDVWFGTDPNKVSGPTTGKYTKIVNGESINTVTIPNPASGVYYWQIDSYLHGKPTTAGGTVDYSTGDPCMLEGSVYWFTNDGPIESVDAGADIITWSGEAVQLTPDVVDDGGSALTYAWTMGPLPAGVEVAVDPGLDVAAPSITFTKAPYANAGIINAGFEDPVIADGTNDGSTPTGWTKTGSSGIADAAIGGIIDIVEEGEQCAWANPEGTFSTVLSETVQAGATYTLSVGIGYGQWSFGAKYLVQLIALDGENEVVLAEDDNSNPPAALQTWSTSIVSYTNDPVADANKVDLSLMIKLVNPADSAPFADVEFDNVVLTSDTLFPVSEDVSSIDLTLTVNDASNPDVSDSMTIDVYLNACQAARAGLGLDADADYDGSCVVDVADLAKMAGQWLDDTSATEAVVDPVQPTGEIVINGDFQTIYEPGNPANAATIADGAYFNIPNQTLYAGAIATYADGTTGSGIEAPGWVIAEGSKTNADVMQGGTWGGPDGSGDMALLCFANWGGPTFVETAAPLSLPIRGPGVEYELSCDIYTNGGPVILELLVDGVVLTPDTESSPALIAGDWVKFTRTYSSVPDGDATIKVGTRDDAGTGWTGNRASIDNVELTFEITDPTAPSVDAGVDMVTWLGEPVQLAPIVEPNELLDPQPVLVYNWTAETVDGLDVDISNPAVESPTVTITGVLAGAVQPVKLTLSVNNEGSSTIVSDTVTIDVYENGCEVIKAVDPSAVDDTDHNIDCTTNLIDFAVLAADWLGDYSLTGPAEKP